MRPVAYISLPIAEFREKVNDFGNDYDALGKWVKNFSKTLAMMGANEQPDDFATRLLDEVETWRKDKAEKMRRLREGRKELPADKPEKPAPEPKTVKAELVNEIPQKKQAKRMFGELQNVLLSDDEEMKLREKLVLPEKFDLAISILSNYKASSGKKYKSDYAAILNWVIGRVEEEFAKRRGSTTGMSQAQRLAIGMAGGR